ncbi:MAG: sugar ABC transporter permease [Candidatus Wallbacteria bacterium HGW-Wallbacteria-1]|uniref:Sugar ABC transporter permease n=1 Tax=Candidatus Wallbacteria bacterium HGW-Wallbacteria-1 TaxID=2013854 RepID=A0A2N1PVJ1_9BACT|nr:MAG: sugar ABC transporter permease [Candidatus Wallbacteria bacterium HGW-Wallbacteria-1]
MRSDRSAYLYILPAAVIILTFHLLPVLTTLILSFYRYEVPSPPVFVGLYNYTTILTDSLFIKSIWNTVIYVVFTIPSTIFFSLLVAMLLNSNIKGVSFYRVVYFLPVITSVNAVALVWNWIYHPQKFGLLNYLLVFLTDFRNWAMGFFGAVPMVFTPIDYLGDPRYAMPAIILMSIWKGLGYNIIIFLAGLQNVPKFLYEAAEIDGAGVWEKFRNITWPLISPTTYFVLIMSTISSFQVFAQIFMMTPTGGPLNSTTVIVFYLYQKAFTNFQMGYASAVALILFSIIFFMTIIQKLFLEKKVHYS